MNLKSFYLLFLLTFIACGSSKNITSINDASTKQVIISHNNATPIFETLAARVQLVHETDKKEQSITVSLRMEKDKNIWIKASILGITIAKVLITPTSVSYYETIGKTYFEGNFELLGDWVGTPIDFQQAQNLLLGQSIFALNPSEYLAAVFQDKFKIQPKQQPQNFIHSIILNPTNFKIFSETLSQPNNERLLSIKYGDYQNLEGQFFPSTIEIDTSEKGSKSKIEINYKKIDLDVAVSFPFDIPKGYYKNQLD